MGGEAAIWLTEFCDFVLGRKSKECMDAPLSTWRGWNDTSTVFYGALTELLRMLDHFIRIGSLTGYAEPEIICFTKYFSHITRAEMESIQTLLNRLE
jgi:hypothetical protein